MHDNSTNHEELSPSPAPGSPQWLADAVICRLISSLPSGETKVLYKDLKNFGFTAILVTPEWLAHREDNSGAKFWDVLESYGLRIILDLRRHSDVLPASVDRDNVAAVLNSASSNEARMRSQYPDSILISDGSFEADISLATRFNTLLNELVHGKRIESNQLWLAYEKSSMPISGDSTGLSALEFQTDGGKFESLALLAQMALPLPPIIQINPSGECLSRDRAELMRSLIFWRNRFHISRITPKLVHADDAGTLLFILDSWLVAINWNADEISIDLGSRGSMWLMLSTHLDVHLHGAMLILPAYSGAILANELAR